MPPLLLLDGVSASYGDLVAIRDVSLEVREGELVALIGSNGAGKTTTLRALSGMIPARGTITYDGADILGKRPEDLVRVGIAHVPQGRGTFPELTVIDQASGSES